MSSDLASHDLKEMHETTWDAIVIGAGPSGALAARRLSIAGARVLLLDKKRFPRLKVCGACLSPWALDELERAGLGSLVARIGGRELSEFHLRFGGRSLRMAMSGGSVVSREQFDQALAASAVDAGSAFLDGTLAEVAAVSNGMRPVRLSRHGAAAQASARAVLIASGQGKAVISAAHEPATLVAVGSRIGAGCRLPAVPAAYGGDAVFMAIGAGGYVGMVRLEDGSLNVAAAFDPALVRRVRTPGAAAQVVLAEAGAPVVCGLADADWRGTAGLTRRTTPLSQDQLFFLGDAAGYVEPFTGEGIAWALASARAIEPLALRAIERWNPRLAREWARTHRRLIGRQQLVCRALALGLAQPWLVRIGFEMLERVPLAATGVMRLLNTPSVYSTASGTCPSC
jgi:flavin-dependent dehydrogenase